MIGIGRYKDTVEEMYWQCVNDIISVTDQRAILKSCKNFMPPNFFSQDNCFKELVLAPYDKLKCAYKYIKKNKVAMEQRCFRTKKDGKKVINKLYQRLYNAYGKVSQRMVDKTKMNVFLVKQTRITVCPYCNRDYINCRSEKAAGSQLDHFYPRSEYPIFSVCLYNLVPACGNCNRIKSKNSQAFASPFDEKIDWDNSLKFSYALLDVNRKKIIIKAKRPIKHNIKAMGIETAYQIHQSELNELLDKAEMYSRTQIEEFREVLGIAGLTVADLRQMVFGAKITEETMKTKPLGRMIRDLEQELGIYD